MLILRNKQRLWKVGKFFILYLKLMSVLTLGIALKGLGWYANWILKRHMMWLNENFLTICLVGWDLVSNGENGFGYVQPLLPFLF